MTKFTGDWETDLKIVAANRIRDGLDPFDRLIWGLYKVELYEQHEIAALSGLTTECVKKRLQRIEYQIIQKK